MRVTNFIGRPPVVVWSSTFQLIDRTRWCTATVRRLFSVQFPPAGVSSDTLQPSQKTPHTLGSVCAYSLALRLVSPAKRPAYRRVGRQQRPPVVVVGSFGSCRSA